MEKVEERVEKVIDRIHEGTAKESTETNFRYAAYGSRIKTALLAASRYTAYTSDIGESFRPIAHPYLVRIGYGVSWAYIIGDVGYETYRAKYHPSVAQTEDWKVLGAKRAVFQTLASMLLPAFTIHSVVKYTGKALKNNSNKTLRTWAPITVGLAIVPGLPFIFDEPVEKAVDAAAAKIESMLS